MSMKSFLFILHIANSGIMEKGGVKKWGKNYGESYGENPCGDSE